MGVPGFLKFLRQVFPSSIARKLPPGIGFVCYDLNGEIYRAIETAIPTSNTPEEFKARFHLELFNKFEALQVWFRPLYGTIVAIDGVPPVSKMHQQKKRRYLAHKNGLSNFDKNSVSPGTPLMIELDTYLTKRFADKIRNFELPPYFVYTGHNIPGEGEHKIFDYIRSGKISAASPKIFLDREETFAATIIYGDDSDLIINAVISPISRLFIVREDKTIVDIDVLRKLLMERMKYQITALHDFVVMMALLGNDFIPASPGMRTVYHSPIDLRQYLTPERDANNQLIYKYPLGITIYSGGADLLLEIYKQLDLPLTTSDHRIAWSNFQRFLIELGKFEPLLLQIYANTETGKQSRLIQKAMITLPNGAQAMLLRGQPSDQVFSDKSYTNLGGDQVRVLDEGQVYHNKTSYRNIWYNNALTCHGLDFPWSPGAKFNALINLSHPSQNEIDDMTIAYLSGIQWTYVYYVFGYTVINTSWYYPYYYSPMLMDIGNLLAYPEKDLRLTTIFFTPAEITPDSELPLFARTLTTPYRYEGMKVWFPIHQLIAILPLTSKNLLPPDFQSLFDPTSPLIDLMPSYFILDDDGQSFPDHGPALIPFIEENRIHMEVQAIYDKLPVGNKWIYLNSIPMVTLPQEENFVGYARYYSHEYHTDYRKFSRPSAPIAKLGEVVVGPPDSQKGHRGGERRGGYHGESRGGQHHEYRGGQHREHREHREHRGGYRGSESRGGHRGSEHRGGYRGGHRGGESRGGYRGDHRGNEYRGNTRGSYRD